MALVSLTKTLNSINRSDIRNEVVNWFLLENPGTGTGALSSRYSYVVESYNGLLIELKRPATLNKGFDFTVHINGMMFKKQRRYSNPSHNDVFSALIYLKNQNTIHYNNIIKPIINNIFNCGNINLSGNSIGFFVDYLGTKRPIEIILLCMKWLFIEQDVTYWNWSGRQMLYNGLISNNLI